MRTSGSGGDVLEERPVCVPSAKQDNGFLPPIKINAKSSLSPLSDTDAESALASRQKQTTVDCAEDANGRRRSSVLVDVGNDHPQPSQMTTSRLSSRMSCSTSSSPTKLPIIDRHNTNSVSSLSSTRSLRHTNGLTNTQMGLNGDQQSSRNDLCRSPSCPQLFWGEVEEDVLDGAVIQNGDLGASIHPHMIRSLNGGPSLKLPDIFSECSANDTSRTNGYSSRMSQKKSYPVHNHVLDSDLKLPDGYTPRQKLEMLSNSNMMSQSKKEADDNDKNKKKKRPSKRTKNKKDETNKISKLSNDYTSVKMDTSRHGNNQQGLPRDAENVDSSNSKGLSQVQNGDGFSGWEESDESKDSLRHTDPKASSSVLLFDDSGAIEQIARENGVLSSSYVNQP